MVDHSRLVLATTTLASSLALVDGSVVNVALPVIGESLGAGAASLQGIISAYLLPLSALLLVGRALVVGAGRLDRRRVLEWVLAWCGFSAARYFHDGEDEHDRIDLAVAALAAAELER
jgi:MFS family permease